MYLWMIGKIWISTELQLEILQTYCIQFITLIQLITPVCTQAPVTSVRSWDNPPLHFYKFIYYSKWLKLQV